MFPQLLQLNSSAQADPYVKTGFACVNVLVKVRGGQKPLVPPTLIT